MNIRAPRPARPLLQRLAFTLRRHLPGARAGDVESVHQARVTSRRLREAVPVLAAGLKGTKAGKATRQIRRLTRALGPVREMDVTLALLDELASTPEVPRTAVEDVRGYVARERDARRGVMLKRIDRVNLEKLSRRLESVQAAVNEATEDPWRRALAARLLQQSKYLEGAIKAAGHMYSPQGLHEVRIAAKKLRYGLELADAGGVRHAAPHVRTIRRAQELLGRLHDLHMLQTYIAAAQIGRESARAEARAALSALSLYVEEQCRRLHGKYLSTSSSLHVVPGAVSKTIVPQLAQESKRRSPLKMVLGRAGHGPAVRSAPRGKGVSHAPLAASRSGR